MSRNGGVEQTGGIERTVWSDERLTDRFDGVDRRLDRIDADLRDLRALMWQLWGTNIFAILVTLVAVIVTRA